MHSRPACKSAIAALLRDPTQPFPRDSIVRGLSSHLVNRRTALLIALLAALLALLIVPLPFRGRLVKALFDAAHLLVGGLLAAIAVRMPPIRGIRSRPAREATAVVVATLAGAGIEVMQGLVGRERSLLDAATNGLGAGAWFLLRRRAAAERPGARRTALAAACILVVVGLIAPGLEGYDAVRQSRDFPLLASFEDDMELSRMRALEAEAHIGSFGSTDGARALSVDLHAGAYPGVTLKWLPEDWSGHTALAFDITVSGDAPLALILKVEDQHHDETQYDYYDRFHRTLDLAPGAHQIEIPLEEIATGPSSRRLNLRRMSRVQWFVDGLTAPRRIYIDHVRLTR